MFDFDNANAAQREAIEAADGPVLITTGTGKTYSMEVGKDAVGELRSQGLGCELAEAPHAIPRGRLRTPASLLGHCSHCSGRWAQAGSTV